LSDIVNFLKSLEFWNNIMYKMTPENAWFLSNLIFLPGDGTLYLEVNSRLGIGVGHSFLVVGGLKDAPRALVREHITPFNPVSHIPPVARGEYSSSTTGALQAHTINWAHGAEKKAYCRWKVAELCQLRRRRATARLLAMLHSNGPPPTFRKL
jgi:hypothetical protein